MEAIETARTELYDALTAMQRSNRERDAASTVSAFCRAARLQRKEGVNYPILSSAD